MKTDLFQGQYDPQWQIQWSSELNSPIPIHCSSLILRCQCCKGFWCDFICSGISIVLQDYKKGLSCREYLFYDFIFLFGNPVMFSLKYFHYFKENKVCKSLCVHWFFTYLNLFTNIIYCCLYTFLSIAISLVIFFPAFFYYPYAKFIGGNWYYVYDFEADVCPFICFTV